MTSFGKIAGISDAQQRASALVQDQIRTGTPYHTQDDAIRSTLQTLDSQQTALTHTTTALWRAIERNYSTDTESDRVGVPWMQMTLPRSEWRKRLDALHTEGDALKAHRAELLQQHGRLTEQIATVQTETLSALRQIFGSAPTLTSHEVEYLSQAQAQVLAAALSDWPSALRANESLQALLPQIAVPDATHVTTDLQLQHAEWSLRNGTDQRFAHTVDGIMSHTPLHAMRKSLLLAQHDIHQISRGHDSLDAAITRLSKLTAPTTPADHDPAMRAAVAQALVLHTGIAAAKGAQIRTTEGSAAFETFFQELTARIDAFEKTAPAEMRNPIAQARLNLVKVLWAAHRYEDAYAAAAQVQRRYSDGSAAQELQAPQSWLYRARPETYAPGGLIREDLSEISFSGLGAAYREAWAHTNENPALAQYGLPVLGCVAGAAVASKLGAAAGTAVGPEGTVLGFGAGAATGCGIGAAAGKVVDWATSAVTAPEVAQALTTGYSDHTWGMTWVQVNFAALDLASTYLLGKAVWNPALGLTQGTLDMGASAYRLGKYAVTQPGAALSDLGSGILTTARVSAAVAQTLAQSLASPVVSGRAALNALADTFRAIQLETYARAATVGGTMALAAAALYPNSADAKEWTWAAAKTKFELMWEAAKRPGALEWSVSVPIFLFGTWAAGRMLWMDKVMLRPLVWNAFKNEQRAQLILEILKKGKMDFWPAFFQASLVNAPWVYQQMEANNVKPLKMSVGSFSDVAYVVGSLLAKAIVQARTGRPISTPVNGPAVDWLRRKNLFDIKAPVWRDYPLFFALNVVSSQINNQTFGLYFTDGELKPWVQRNLVQPAPMFPRKFIALSLGLDSYGGMFVDWVLNTYENRMLTWFFPPWTGRQNWKADFNKFDTTTTWEDMVEHFDSKMEYGTLQVPNHDDMLPWESRLQEIEFSDFYNELCKGTLSKTAIDAVAKGAISLAEPATFSELSLIEKRFVLIHLAMFAKVTLNPVTEEAQRALQPHLSKIGLQSIRELATVSIDTVIERLNRQKFSQKTSHKD